MAKLLLSAGLLLLISGLWLFFQATSQPTLASWDLHLIALFAEHRHVVLTQIAQALAWLGGMPAVLLISALYCVYQYRRQQFAQLAFIAAAVLGSIAISWSLKMTVDRPRPDAMWAIFPSYGDAFPSGHSLYAGCFSALLILLTQQHAKRHIFFAAALLWLVLMGLSRIYLGVHHLSDVLAGSGLGLIWVTLLWYALQHKILFGQSTLPTKRYNN